MYQAKNNPSGFVSINRNPRGFNAKGILSDKWGVIGFTSELWALHHAKMFGGTAVPSPHNQYLWAVKMGGAS